MARKNNVKAILFDLDGTLMNTKQGILLSLDQIVEAHGLEPIPFSQKKSFVGPPMQQSLMNHYGISKGLAHKYAMEFRKLYAGDNCLLARTYPHMRTTLALLRLEGYRLGVATYKRQDVAQKVLDHFGLSKYFDVIFGSDFQGTLTKSDIVARAVEAVGAKPENTIMIGDTRGDGLAAKDVGCKFIPVTYGYGFVQAKEANDLLPVGVCHSVDDIRDACKQAFKKNKEVQKK